MEQAQNQPSKVHIALTVLGAVTLYSLWGLGVLAFGHLVPILLFLPVIPFCVWIALLKGLERPQAWLFGISVGLKMAVVFTIGPHLAVYPAEGLFASWGFWNAVYLVGGLVWIVAECRPLKATRVISLLALAFVCQLADDYLGQHNVMYPFAPTNLNPGIWGHYRSELVRLYLPDFIVSAVYELIWFILAGMAIALLAQFTIKPKSQTSEAASLPSVKTTDLIWGRAFNLYAVVAGAVATSVLVGLFFADNSAFIRGVPSRANMMAEGHPWIVASGLFQNRLLWHLVQFDGAALKAASSGILQSAPFILGGCFSAWLASRYRLAGLVPILAIGALCGLGWHLAYPNHGYWTPFMSTMQSAVLIGMIAACGFGAVAQLVDRRARTRDETV
jgi:hypothetical protein